MAAERAAQRINKSERAAARAVSAADWKRAECGGSERAVDAVRRSRRGEEAERYGQARLRSRRDIAEWKLGGGAGGRGSDGVAQEGSRRRWKGEEGAVERGDERGSIGGCGFQRGGSVLFLVIVRNRMPEGVGEGCCLVLFCTSSFVGAALRGCASP